MYRIGFLIPLALVTEAKFLDKLVSRGLKAWSHRVDMDQTTNAKVHARSSYGISSSRPQPRISHSPSRITRPAFPFPGIPMQVPKAMPEVQAPPDLPKPDPLTSGQQVAVPANLPSEEQLLALQEFLKGVPDVPVQSQYMPQKLRNRYIGLRHGQSLSNVEGIISSNPELGPVKHGLTELGVDQARQSASPLLELIGRDGLRDTVFISSNFLRARQTADIAIAGIGQNLGSELVSQGILEDRLRIDDGLRERFFGDLDAQSLVEYNKVWPVDTRNADNSDFGVESINQVVQRVGEVIRTLEEQEEGKTFVLVSHADTLQIIQTFLCWSVLKSVDPRMFSQYRFANGEVRDMLELPAPVPLIFDGINK